MNEVDDSDASRQEKRPLGIHAHRIPDPIPLRTQFGQLRVHSGIERAGMLRYARDKASVTSVHQISSRASGIRPPGCSVKHE